jgi:hypothetical protein
MECCIKLSLVNFFFSYGLLKQLENNAYCYHPGSQMLRIKRVSAKCLTRSVLYPAPEPKIRTRILPWPHFVTEPVSLLFSYSYRTKESTFPLPSMSRLQRSSVRTGTRFLIWSKVSSPVINLICAHVNPQLTAIPEGMDSWSESLMNAPLIFFFLFWIWFNRLLSARKFYEWVNVNKRDFFFLYSNKWNKIFSKVDSVKVYEYLLNL